MGTRLGARWLDWKRERWAAAAEPEVVGAYVELFGRPGLPMTPADPSVPVLILTGAHDGPHFLRAAVEPAIRKVYPDAELAECAGSGHYPMQQTPPLFASLVERFIRRAPDA